jgi:hypothetical protein
LELGTIDENDNSTDKGRLLKELEENERTNVWFWLSLARGRGGEFAITQ